jgi:hypothetical protein
MTHRALLAWFFPALSLLASGCAASETSSRSPRSLDECAEESGDDCSCDDGASGEIVCVDGDSECDCGFDDDDEVTGAPPRDAGKSRGDAGRDAGGVGDASTRGDAGRLPARDGGGTTTRDGGSTSPRDPGLPPIGEPIDEPADPPVSGEGSAPVIPPAPTTCPELRSGTATIGGLGGIALQVGAKKQGTGALLFYWHGTGSSSGEALLMLPAAVRQEILAEGGIIVAFQGSTRRGGDCSGTATFSQGDFEVADQIVACAVKNHGINPRRIYTTGCSAGGLQAGCMASRRSGYIAADTVIVTFSRTSATLGNQFAQAGGFVLNCNHGGGHCAAPAALQSAGWRFMKDHPFGVSPEPYVGGVPSTFPSYCKVVGK